MWCLIYIEVNNMNGCELLKCPYYKDNKCTDDPKYETICRFNTQWLNNY